MRNLITLLLLQLLFTYGNAQNSNVALGSSNVYQSNTLENYTAEKAIDRNINTYSNTGINNNSWFKIDLDSPHTINGLKIHAPRLNDFYLFFSKLPINDADIPGLLDDPWVDYIHVQEGIPLSGFIPTTNIVASYIAIIKSGEGAVEINEIGLMAAPIGHGGAGGGTVNGGDQGANNHALFGLENCGNGIDDDGDGRVDCDDPACGVGQVKVQKQNATCAECTDGSICIQASMGVEFSIDGGISWETGSFGLFSGSICFDNLPIGDYEVLVRRPTSRCMSDLIDVEIEVGLRGADCTNIDFELGDYTNWNGQTADLNGSQFSPLQPGFVDPNYHQIISTAGFVDANAPNLNLSGIGANPNILRLGKVGFLAGSNSGIATATYCINVDGTNSAVSFIYAFVADNPIAGHLQNQFPFMSYRIYLENDPTQQNLLNKGDLIFSNSPLTQAGNGNWRYTPFECRSFNLSQFNGESVCIEFSAAGCLLGGHGAYAYIDMSCGVSGVAPTADIDIEYGGCAGSIPYLNIDANVYESFQIEYNVLSSTGNILNSHLMDEEFEVLNELYPLEDILSIDGFNLACDQSLQVNIELFNGCTATTVSEIIEYPCNAWRAFLPNIFSPNNDGVNDEYFIGLNSTDYRIGDEDNPVDSCSIPDWDDPDHLTGISFYRMEIYDSWANLLLEEEISDPNSDLKGTELTWDGSFNGTTVVPYVYVAKYYVESCFLSNLVCSSSPCGDNQAWQYCSTGELHELELSNGEVKYVEIFEQDVTVVL